MSDSLLPESTRRRLSGLRFAPRKAFGSGTKGERRSTKRGTSLEFADYREYTAGDDLRKLDWNVFARLNRPIIKLYEDEEDLTVHVLLDNSASMSITSEAMPTSKAAYARSLCAAVGMIALSSGDRLTVTLLDAPQRAFITRGRGQVAALLQMLSAPHEGAQVNLSAALKTAALREKRAGLCLLISDLFTDDLWTGVNALLGRGHEVVIVHTLSPDELSPTIVGDLRLTDVESGTSQELSADLALLTRYETTLRAWLSDIRAECTRRQITYVQIATDQPPEQLLLRDLRRLGVLR